MGPVTERWGSSNWSFQPCFIGTALQDILGWASQVYRGTACRWSTWEDIVLYYKLLIVVGTEILVEVTSSWTDKTQPLDFIRWLEHWIQLARYQLMAGVSNVQHISSYALRGLSSVAGAHTCFASCLEIPQHNPGTRHSWCSLWTEWKRMGFLQIMSCMSTLTFVPISLSQAQKHAQDAGFWPLSESGDSNLNSSLGTCHDCHWL